jgi:hypothetical protein
MNEVIINPNLVAIEVILRKARIKFIEGHPGVSPDSRKLKRAYDDTLQWLEKRYPPDQEPPLMDSTLVEACAKLGESYYGRLYWRFKSWDPWNRLLMVILTLGILIATVIALVRPNPPLGWSQQDERYAETWIFYDKVNDTIPQKKLYMDRVIGLLSDASKEQKRPWHIFFIGHGDSVDNDRPNKSVTDRRVCWFKQIIEAEIKKRDDDLWQWYSKAEKHFWSFGKSMLVEVNESQQYSKEGECVNRRVQVIATTNPFLVRWEYLTRLKGNDFPDYDQPEKECSPMPEGIKQVLKQSELRLEIR